MSEESEDKSPADQNAAGEQIEDFDLSKSNPSVPSDPAVSLAKEPYDPRPHEDGARRNIAYILLGILAAVCLFAFLIVIALPDRIKDTIQMLQVIFTPIIALVSAATGFYYGTKK